MAFGAYSGVSDSAGIIYVAVPFGVDGTSGSPGYVEKILPDGTAATGYPLTINTATGLSIGPNGVIWVSDYTGNKLVKVIDPPGAPTSYSVQAFQGDQAVTDKTCKITAPFTGWAPDWVVRGDASDLPADLLLKPEFPEKSGK